MPIGEEESIPLPLRRLGPVAQFWLYGSLRPLSYSEYSVWNGKKDAAKGHSIYLGFTTTAMQPTGRNNNRLGSDIAPPKSRAIETGLHLGGCPALIKGHDETMLLSDASSR